MPSPPTPKPLCLNNSDPTGLGLGMPADFLDLIGVEYGALVAAASHLWSKHGTATQELYDDWLRNRSRGARASSKISAEYTALLGHREEADQLVADIVLGMRAPLHEHTTQRLKNEAANVALIGKLTATLAIMGSTLKNLKKRLQAARTQRNNRKDEADNVRDDVTGGTLPKMRVSCGLLTSTWEAAYAEVEGRYSLEDRAWLVSAGKYIQKVIE
jgi:hypothetical protein